MKRTIKVFAFCYFLSLLVVTMLCNVSVNAVDLTSNSNSLLDVIDAQNAKEELLKHIENAEDPDFFLDSTPNQLVFKRHLMGIWYYDGITQLQDPNGIPQFFDNVISDKEKQSLSYIVIGEEITSVFLRPQGSSPAVVTEKLQNAPNYIQDIMNEKVIQLSTITDVKDYKNIVCIDGYLSHQGAVVYYLTETGGTVLYYKDEYSQAQVFSFIDFQNYACAYKQYITSYDLNYTANGSPKVGVISFLEFVNNQPEQKASSNVHTEFFFGTFIVMLIIVVGVWVWWKKRVET